MSLTENSDQVFLPGGCNRTQNLRFGPYTNVEYTQKRLNDIRPHKTITNQEKDHV